MKIISLMVTFMLISANFLHADKPADRRFGFRQPDGSTILLESHGDAFFHYRTTTDGHLVLTGPDGWICYAWFNEAGELVNSNVPVGHPAPDALLASSRIIPQDLILRLRQQRIARRLPSPVPPRLQSTRTPETDRYGLVILAEYKNVPFQYTREDFIDMLTKKDYDRFGALGSAAQYFDEQFGGQTNFHFDVSPIVTLPKSRAYYGANRNGQDERPEEMIATACKLADPHIDFSRYDSDHDGIVDNVFVFFAGGDEAENINPEECIWSHAYYIYSGDSKTDLVLDNVRIDRYACTSELTYRIKNTGKYHPELAGIGTFCHEYTHTFGLPDFYDTDYERSGGTAEAFWRTTSLMDGGNHNAEGNCPPYFNAVEREMLGLSVPVEIVESGSYTLEPIHLSGQCYRISTDNPDEYFLLECRYPEGWDRHCGGKGMLVYHIDRSDRPAGYSDSYQRELSAKERWSTYNEVNCRPRRQCAALLAANPASKEAEGVFWPQDRKTAIFGSDLKFWDGGESGVSLKNIRLEGKNIRFDATVSADKLFPTEVKTAVFMTSAIIDFKTRQEVSKVLIKRGIPGHGNDPSTDLEITPYAPEKFSVRLENLKPDTKYIVTLVIQDQNAGTISMNFKTLQPTVLSYLPLKEIQGRYSDGHFEKGSGIPLEVVSPEIPVKVNWTFDGIPVKTGPDHRFHPERSGPLKAEIYYKNGRKDTVIREIKID